MITLGNRSLSVFRAGSAAALARRLADATAPQDLGRASAPGELAVAIVAQGADDLRAKRRRAADTLAASGKAEGEDIHFEPRPFGAGSMVFLFPGQGSQYPGMLEGYRALESFREAARSLDRIAAPIFSRSLEELIFAPGETNAMSGTLAAQGSIGFVSAAMARCLGAFGVRAGIAAGHSYGELVALWYAQALDDAAFLRLTERRGSLMAAAVKVAPGAMAAVGADEQRLVELLRGYPDIEIANLNTPRQTVIAGDAQALERFAQVCSEQKITMLRLVNTAGAFHTSRMASALDGWGAFLNGMAGRGELDSPRGAVVVANVTAAEYPRDGGGSAAGLLAQQLVGRVRWREICEHLYQRGARIFVEVGPGDILSRMLHHNLGDRPHLALNCDPKGGDTGGHFLKLLARLAVQGVALNAPSAPNQEKRNEVRTMNPHVDTVMREFFAENGRVVKHYFEFAEKIIDTSSAPPAEVLLRFLDHSAQITADYLHAHERVLLAAGSHGAVRAMPGASMLGQEPPAPLPAALALPMPPPMPSPAAVPAAANDEDLESWLRAQFAQATGFPAASIELGARLADLGIESLTFAELFGRIVTRIPAARDKAEALFQAKTIGAVLEILQQAMGGAGVGAQAVPQSAAPAVASSTPPAAAADAVQWSPEILGLRQRIFAALRASGRVSAELDDATSFDELGLNAFEREALWQATVLTVSPYRLAGEALMAARTIAEALSLLSGLEANPAQKAQKDCLDRYLRVEVPRSQPAQAALPGRLLLAGAGDEAYLRFAAALSAAGVDVVSLVLTPQGWRDSGGDVTPLEQPEALAQRLQQIRGDGAMPVIFLSRAAAEQNQVPADSWEELLECNGVGLFCLAKALAASPQALAAYGHLGVVLSQGVSPANVAARGVARCLSHEWRDSPAGVSSLAVFDPLADPALIVRILLSSAGAHDLTLRPEGLFEGVLERSGTAAGAAGGAILDRESVVLLFGGGVGIGAEIACDLAARYGCTIAAIGRTPWDGADPFPQARDDAALSEAVFAELSQRGKRKPAAAALQKALRQARRQRALDATASRVRGAGGRFEYFCADATVKDDVMRAMAELHRKLGRLDLVVHAAGIVEDRLAAAKPVESFRRVLHTKALSAFHLRQALNGFKPKYLTFFSSLVSHTGNAGQTDYCAANEVLNALAQTWPEQDTTRAVSFLWSVWTETGLAGHGVQQLLEKHALAGIGSAEGARYFHDELALGGQAPWVLITSPRTLDVMRRGPLN